MLPYRRAQLRKEIKETVTQMREQLNKVLTEHFEAELRGCVDRTEQALAPFTYAFGLEAAYTPPPLTPTCQALRAD